MRTYENLKNINQNILTMINDKIYKYLLLKEYFKFYKYIDEVIPNSIYNRDKNIHSIHNNILSYRISFMDKFNYKTRDITNYFDIRTFTEYGRAISGPIICEFELAINLSIEVNSGYHVLIYKNSVIFDKRYTITIDDINKSIDKIMRNLEYIKRIVNT